MNSELYKNQTLKNREKKHRQIQDLRETIDLLHNMNMTILKGDKDYVALSAHNLDTITKKRHKTVSTCAAMSAQQFEEANA